VGAGGTQKKTVFKTNVEKKIKVDDGGGFVTGYADAVEDVSWEESRAGFVPTNVDTLRNPFL